jgi:uncharacterized protein (TIGR03435 family)
MMLSAFSTTALVNHLWQSTVVTLMAWLLTLPLRRNQARTRYWVWMIASIKFLVPFSLLIAGGEALRSTFATPVVRPAVSALMEQITRPFPQIAFHSVGGGIGVSLEPASLPRTDWTPVIPLLIWLSGFLVLIVSWARSWWKVRAVVRSASSSGLVGRVPLLTTPQLIEPGVFGIVRPVLLMPETIHEQLTAEQLQTILAHEMCHVRRRDNLTAAIHTLVQAAFWFHPAVWWIKARLLDERERACDEAVVHSGNGAQLYAESILHVCKLYVGPPMACVSGVTGSDLKRRIVRIMSDQAVRRLDASRKVLLAVVATVAVAMPVTFGLVHVTRAHAQAKTDAQNIADTWQGTLHAGQDLRTVVKITKDGAGYQAAFYSIDQGGMPLKVTKITLDGSTVKMTLTMIGGSYEGKLSPDGKTITGTWTQGSPLPLVLTRATPETEWAIPVPPPPIPPMDANANPSFEVATIKPSKPDDPRKAFIVNGRHFQIINQPLVQVLCFAYEVQAKQLVGLPPWAETEKYDIDAQPDGEGAPSDKQWKGMLQKLVAERFKLTFHKDKKELPVYVLSVAKSGPKLTKSEGDPNGLPGLFFRGKLGDLGVRNANMADFRQLMQSAVLDRPVIDQTELKGRFDFTLLWTPDDSQFQGMGAKIPPPTDAANAPPNLYTAIQEQLGLKLDATKALADVMVVDHAEQPSAN